MKLSEHQKLEIVSGFLSILIMISPLLIYNSLKKAKIIRERGLIKKLDSGNLFRPSFSLQGYFPLRANDNDFDGSLDSAERLVHAGPRVPYAWWEDIPKDSKLFYEIQKEYSSLYSTI